jgi:glycosyltransferase involved in cell wall biosynthesis
MAYRAAKVVINPIRYGSGLKIKTVEALSKGKALVTTECGASGIMKGRDEAFMIGNFSKNIIDLMKNDKIHKDLCKGALEFAQQNFSKDQAYGELIKEIRRIRR